MPLENRIQQAYRRYCERESWFGTFDRLQKIKEYAREHVAFYKGSHVLDNNEVFTKKDYIKCQSNFKSAAELFGKSDIGISTSGTSGKKTNIDLDPASWFAVNFGYFRNVMDVLGYDADEIRKFKIGVMFVSNKSGRNSFQCANPILNDSLYFRLQLGSDVLACKEELKLFFNMPSYILYGKPSYLLHLRKMLLALGLEKSPWTPSFVLTSGESLYTNQKIKIKDFFGAPVVDAVSSSESGLMALKHESHGTYKIVDKNLSLSIQKHGDNGQQAYGYVISSNLAYTGTVFLNYLTEDLVKYDKDTKDINWFYGKNLSHLETSNGPIDTMLVEGALSNEHYLEDYRIFKNGVEWVFEYSLEKNDEDARRGDISDAMKCLREVLESSSIRPIQRECVVPNGGKSVRYPLINL
ncbi:MULTISPECIES: hypothetical protein [Pseudomonas syringae group]|uniref:CoA ligase n=2 Tax=Pseudomonas syringae group TaxID=136849 RepID=A0A0P9N0S4_PSESX|nr:MULTISPECIES: hypothetical protein [Pseudomonas syringae group]KPW98508.1 CoA ligase [Pseudomonas syringae pv. castaneae]KWS93176.1 hypothetical protein AL048_26305 [Pseudomonas syringae pv. castaneae]RMS92124.1 CoA ligase [Pseudomonas savastanoi]